ncbi:hemolysin activation/secretion protein [Sphingomonas naasensis]|nr:ShlB/FhaC/HecB family hemolysin secretion/activation protein [Sphingomonas naasensis]NIJ21000.1 hemolysin activation/secretion protein [Sphingomonas naasensis]
MLFWSCVGADAALAQDFPRNPLPTREELDPARRTETSTRVRANPLFSPLRAPCAFAEMEQRFKLTSVEFLGATALTARQLAPAYQDLLNSEVPLSAACEIRDRAAALFFREGILARVEIPRQEITDGKLTIEVIEAHLSDVRVSGDVGPVRRKIEQYINKARSDGPFDLDKVQRYLLLASDIPGVRITTTIRPITGQRGAVALEIEVTRDLLDTTFNIHNLASETSGPWTALARVDVNSLTAFGDRTSISAYASRDLKKQRVIQFAQEGRFGSQGLVARTSLSYAEGHPGGLLGFLGLNTQSIVSSTELSYPIVRKRRENLTLANGLEMANQKTRFGEFTVSEDRIRVAFARLQGNVSDAIGTVPISAAGSIEVRKGLDILNASDPGAIELSRFDADPRAGVVRANLFAQAQLSPVVSVSIRTEAQTATGPLVSYEEISAGNFTIGRGYDAGVISGERGVASAFEITMGPFGNKTASASLFAFLDAARVDNFDLGGESASVKSVGGGFRAVVLGSATLDVTMAVPLTEPFRGFGKPDPRVLVNLTTRF